jgi:hypothetical protein
MRAFRSNSKHSINFSQILEECQILLSLQEMDLEVRETELAEKQACDLHFYDRQDLSAELEELRACVVGIED